MVKLYKTIQNKEFYRIDEKIIFFTLEETKYSFKIFKDFNRKLFLNKITENDFENEFNAILYQYNIINEYNLLNNYEIFSKKTLKIDFFSFLYNNEIKNYEKEEIKFVRKEVKEETNKEVEINYDLQEQTYIISNTKPNLLCKNIDIYNDDDNKLSVMYLFKYKSLLNYLLNDLKKSFNKFEVINDIKKLKEENDPKMFIKIIKKYKNHLLKYFTFDNKQFKNYLTSSSLYLSLNKYNQFIISKEVNEPKIFNVENPETIHLKNCFIITSNTKYKNNKFCIIKDYKTGEFHNFSSNRMEKEVRFE